MMSLRALKAAPIPDEVVVPRLHDDPRYAEAAGLLSAFEERSARLSREKDRLNLARRLGSRPANEDGPADKELRARLAIREAEPPLPTFIATHATAAPGGAVALGLEILRGNAPPRPPDHAAQICELDRQIEALRAAIFEQTEAVDRIAGELTVEFATRLKPAWDALQLQWYRDAQALARSTRRVREMRAAIVAAGIRSRTDILAMPNVRAPLILGDESDWGSEITGWRKILEKLEILK